MQAENMDPEFFSEAEALAEYRTAHGIDNPDTEAAGHAGAGADPVRARVDALNHLQLLLAAQPQAGDRLDAWFARPVATRLRNVGLATPEDLVHLVNVYGHRWHDQIRGFWRQRAAQVVAWLRLQQEGEVDEPRQARALGLGLDAGRLILPPRFALVPLELGEGLNHCSWRAAMAPTRPGRVGTA